MTTTTEKKRKRGSSTSDSESSPTSHSRDEAIQHVKKTKVQDDAPPLRRTESCAKINQVDALERLLDLSAIDNQSQLEERFDTIAKTLLCDYYLSVNQPGRSTKLEIMELEFYLQKEGFHEDPFTHGSEEQKISGRWYFHRAPRHSADSNRSLTSAVAWRGGSRKGLDLSIGRPLMSLDGEGTTTLPDELLRGGILLRSIRVLGPNSKIVSGPSLLVDEILSQNGVSEIGKLVNDKWNGDTSAFSRSSSQVVSTYSLHLIPKPQKSDPSSSSLSSHFGKSLSPVVYCSPRIGLDLSHPGTTDTKVVPLHSRIRFLPRMYRYFREPFLLVANGRPQTFVGVMLYSIKKIVSSQGPATTISNAGDDQVSRALKSPLLLLDVCRITGLKEATARKYLGDYLEGRRGRERVVDGFIGPACKGASSSPSSYLKLMGALSVLVLDVFDI